VSDNYENILIDLMPDDLGISSMHLSGKLFQMINNKNKTMIVEMKAPSVCFDDSNNGLKVRIFVYSYLFHLGLLF
jgi:hypothetical protein